MSKQAAKQHPMPFMRVEVAAFAIVECVLCVLLGQREEEPYAGKWALPGGAVRIDLDDDLEASARRVMQERLGHELPYLRQQGVFGGRDRDPRAPWAVSVVYRALPGADQVQPVAGKRMKELKWAPVAQAMANRALAFDHAALIRAGVASMRAEIEALILPEGLVPAEFTLGELQTICETVLDRHLDKSSFRRRLADNDVVEPVAGAMRTGAFRPAQVYRLKRRA